MALAEKKVFNFSSYRGTPDSDTEWNKLEWGFDARQVKIIVTAGDLDISLNGKDLFNVLPGPAAGQNPTQYDFREVGISRLWVRNTTAVAEVIAYGTY